VLSPPLSSKSELFFSDWRFPSYNLLRLSFSPLSVIFAIFASHLLRSGRAAVFSLFFSWSSLLRGWFRHALCRDNKLFLFEVGDQRLFPPFFPFFSFEPVFSFVRQETIGGPVGFFFLNVCALVLGEHLSVGFPSRAASTKFFSRLKRTPTMSRCCSLSPLSDVPSPVPDKAFGSLTPPFNIGLFSSLPPVTAMVGPFFPFLSGTVPVPNPLF